MTASLLSKMYIPDGMDEADCVKECNGCGARDGINVPDSVFGLSIVLSCNIHDYMYSHHPKKEADDKFLYNMRTQVKEGSKWLLYPRIKVVYTYYLAVKFFGDKAYNG